MDTSEAYLDGCPFAPGSPEKVAILTERARLRLPLFIDSDTVDFARASRGGHARKLLPRKRPDTWRRLDEIATALRHGASYRDVARLLKCSIGQVHRLVDCIAREAG